MWITQPKAAAVLGVHPQRVAKLVARGDLTSRGQSGRHGSLGTATKCAHYTMPDSRPSRGEGGRWFRRDHLELVKHADLVKRPRRQK